MEKTVHFYFAYNSPYSFLASSRIEEELAPCGAELKYYPVYSPRRGGGPDVSPARFRYLLEDVGRFANAYGLRLNPGPFADTKKACLGFLFADGKGRRKPYHDGVYRARFLEAQDIGQEEVLADIAERGGLDRREFLEALRDPTYEAALEASNKDAEANDVFGFPFFIYERQKFWGNDRIEWLVQALEAERGGTR